MSDTNPSTRWWIEDPPVIQEDDLSFLCHVCRHINFKTLILESTIMDVLDEVALDSFSNILNRKHCAFCRLIKKTTDNVFGLDVLPTHHDGTEVKVSMIPFLEPGIPGKPRQLLLWIKPNPFADGNTPPLLIQEVQKSSSLFDVTKPGKGRLITPQIEFLLPLFWNLTCRKAFTPLHKNLELERDGYELPAGFRLIDTVKGCIVPAEPSYEYITLSYVWGQGRALKLLNENYHELTQENGLAKYTDQIPQTIQDAMLLVKKLEDRYLWVDALCIIQDNPDDKQAQISAMDRIYGSSVLTIAATCGEGADAGLPGVRPGTRSMIQGVETIQGLRLANRPWSFEKSVNESRWNTRAWTFQERILTKRILFITAQQMFFKCDHSSAYVAEDFDNNLPARKAQTSWPMDDTGIDVVPERWSINVLSYQQTVQKFVERDITYPGDVLNAFDGIAQRMTTMFRSKFLAGLPESELDYFLLWEPWGKYTRRCDENGSPMFPSWSWAGWVGPLRFNWEERLSRIKWVNDSDEQYTSDEYRSIYFGSANPEKVSAWRNEWTELRTRSGFRYFTHPSNPDLWFRNPVAPQGERNPRLKQLSDGRLRFWAWVVDLDLQAWVAPTPKENEGPLWNFPLSDQNGHSIGFIRVPVEVLPQIDPKTKRYDLVLIARTRHNRSHEELRAAKDPANNVKPAREVEDEDAWLKKPLEEYVDEQDISAEPHFFEDELSTADRKFDLGFDGQRFDAYKPFCLFEILVVEWSEGVAYRIGLGKIHIDAWALEKPVWKLITLG